MTRIALEARCLDCGETFTPVDETDTMHLVREDDTECGGQGRIVGEWRGSAASLAGAGYDEQMAETVRLLESGHAFTAASLAARIGVSTSRCGDLLRALHTTGRVQRSGRPHLYRWRP